MPKHPHMHCYAVGDTGQFEKTVSEYDVYALAGIVAVGKTYLNVL